MYIDKVELHNIKGFEKLSFSLERPDGRYAGWTVFTGNNGAGKSALLKAIVVALTGRDVARSLQPSFHRWIHEGQGAERGKISLTIVPEKGVDEYLSKGGTTYSKFVAELPFWSMGGEAFIEDVGNDKRKNTAQRGPWSARARGWFSCGYGPFRRVFGASPEATRLMVGPVTERYVTMFQEAASLYEVDQWLRSLSHKSLEKRAPEQKLLSIVLQFLKDNLMPNEITVDTVDSDGLWLRDRNGLRLAWADMSDGYRAALALLTDILRHLVKTYGMEDLVGKSADGTLQVLKSGVVMIDEIDAHLHPEWQREIGFWMKKHFPNIQFLVTTHSPLVCQAADPNGLFVLPEPGSSEAPRAMTSDEYATVISSRSDVILRSAAFGLSNTRSPQAVAAREKYSTLKSKERAGARLTRAETNELSQLQLFVTHDSEG